MSNEKNKREAFRNWLLDFESDYDRKPKALEAWQHQQARIDKLLEALKPFSEFAKHFPKEGGKGNRPRSGEIYSVSDIKLGDASFTVEHIHHAAKLIAEIEAQS